MREASKNDTAENAPASQRPITNQFGHNADLHYTKAHLRKILEMREAGRRVKLPAGIESVEHLRAIVKGEAFTPSTETGDAGKLSRTSGSSSTGTAGSRDSGE